MQRYAIVKSGVVVNVVEYETPPIGTPPGFEDGVIAIQDAISSPGWLYADGVFSNPNPPQQPTKEQQ
jgi:hypothetical protein